MAVLARAYVTLRVQRVPAQGARRPAGGDDTERALGERPGSAGRQPDPEQVTGELRRLGFGRLLSLPLDLGLRLDQYRGGLLVPREGERADPELLLDRRSERSDVLELGRCGRGDDGVGPLPAAH